MVGKANTLDKALKAVGQFEKLGVQVATIDGNLSEEGWTGDDGRALVAAINRLAPNVKTVSMSAGIAVPGTNVNVGKLKIENLGSVVTKL